MPRRPVSGRWGVFTFKTWLLFSFWCMLSYSEVMTVSWANLQQRHTTPVSTDRTQPDTAAAADWHRPLTTCDTLRSGRSSSGPTRPPPDLQRGHMLVGRGTAAETTQPSGCRNTAYTCMYVCIDMHMCILFILKAFGCCVRVTCNGSAVECHVFYWGANRGRLTLLGVGPLVPLVVGGAVHVGVGPGQPPQELPAVSVLGGWRENKTSTCQRNHTCSACPPRPRITRTGHQTAPNFPPVAT